MKTLLVIGLLFVTLVGGFRIDEDQEDYSDELFYMDGRIVPYVTCKIGEMSCSPDCKNVEICLGGGILDVIEECGNDSLCDASTLTCNPNLIMCNVVDKTKFTCRGTVGGRFPSPYDCHGYFECEDPIPSPPAVVNEIICIPNTTAYDALSGTCRFPPSHRVCREGPVPKCTMLTQSGPVIENPNIFYVCVSIEGVLQPILSRCPRATEVFEGGECVDVDSTTPSTASEDPTTTTAQTTDTTPTTTPMTTTATTPTTTSPTTTATPPP